MSISNNGDGYIWWTTRHSRNADESAFYSAHPTGGSTKGGQTIIKDTFTGGKVFNPRIDRKVLYLLHKEMRAAIALNENNNAIANDICSPRFFKNESN